MRTSVRTAVALGVLAAALAACTTGTTPPPAGGGESITLSYYLTPETEAPPLLAAAVAVSDPDFVLPVAVDAEAASPAALIDAGNGLWLGPLAFPAEDGTIEVELPELDADLQALLVPAEELIRGNDPVACPVTVSDEAVMVTQMRFLGAPLPSVVLLTTWGMFESFVTAEEVASTDLWEFGQDGIYALIYATGPVDVTATDPGCVDQFYSFDLSLEEGWNWVRMTAVLTGEPPEPSHWFVQEAEEPAEPKVTFIPLT